MRIVANLLSPQIEAIVKSVANDNPACEEAIITNVIEGYCDIRLNTGDSLKHLKYIGTPLVDGKCLVVYPNGEQNNPLVLAIDIDNTETSIIAMGCGLFKIKNDGKLYVELPVGMENIFSIDENGVLCVELPEGASNDYSIRSDGMMIYKRDD